MNERIVPRPPPDLRAEAHKGDAGRVLCVVGSSSMPGAAILVARSAQRAGAGLVTIGCLDAVLMQVVPAAAPEAVLADLCDAFDLRGHVGPGARALLVAREPHALLAGPGLGDDARARAVLEHVLAARPGAPRVLDADALNALAGEPDRLRKACGPVVITPHPGEAARLMGAAVPGDSAGRIEAARELQRRSGAVVVLKGHGTIVTDGERTYVNDTGNPGMATAGAGDVLAGILVAYAARGAATGAGVFGAFEAAVAAVHVHGRAGDLAARRLGEGAVVASDLIDSLPFAQGGPG